MKTNKLYVNAAMLTIIKNRNLDYFLKSTFGTSRTAFDPTEYLI